ncbi:uncharacterized protein [Henckelia pumila]|uniref:uncharacterized protein n=1 Tax=Henckelia pumila TaxID=405737 RepID=UPI003C6E301A
MAKKGSQQKKGFDQRSTNDKGRVSDPGAVPLTTEESGDAKDEKVTLGEGPTNESHSESCTNSIDDTDRTQCGKTSKKKSKKSQRKERKDADETMRDETLPSKDSTEAVKPDERVGDTSKTRDKYMFPDEIFQSNGTNSLGNLPNGLHMEDGLDNVEFPQTVVFKFLRTGVFSIARKSAEWLERSKPSFVILKNNILKARDHVQVKIQHAQPIVFRWIKHFGKIMLLLFMVWLDCTLRGFDSFLRMGTSSFFSIVWCSALSVITMAGIGKFLMVLAVAAAAGLFLGLILAVVFIGVAGMVILWFYGSFWTTGLVIFLGGVSFILSHDRIALFIMSAYSVYCAFMYVGWLGLVLAMNLSFISSDALLFFLRSIINEQRTPNSQPEQATGMRGQPSFHPNEFQHTSSSETSNTVPPDRSQGVPSTSGSDSELTSEDEVVRLLRCTDHYSALGLSRFENIDVSAIKREYRKKAMLVHPDKNMGNEKSAEAFKKLQNAYEVLLDSFKRKEYDEELRREELLNYFRKFQNASRENKRHGLFTSNFARTEDGEDPMGESRRIACKKCGLFHIWVHTKKLKSRARWCQECQDFHPAKDGDGWVEQSSQPLFFGMLQKVEAPSAYVCAAGKVYDATEWYHCQGMRCAANAHKPTFQVNTNAVTRNGRTRGTNSGQRGGIPSTEETMSEEEFFEWLQNAMQSGMFENLSGTSENPSGFSPQGAGGSSSNINNKRKKGKKQR